MTHEEITDLLELVVNAYPNAMKSISNPDATIRAWEMAFGNDEAESVYKAARLHMDLSPFFPTIADIKSNMRKGELVYGLPPEAPQKLITGDVSEDAPCRLDRCILYHDLCNGLDEDGNCPFEGI